MKNALLNISWYSAYKVVSFVNRKLNANKVTPPKMKEETSKIQSILAKAHNTNHNTYSELFSPKEHSAPLEEILECHEDDTSTPIDKFFSTEY